MKTATKKLTELEELSSNLLTTLDETLFFSQLGDYFSSIFPIDQVAAYLVREKSVVLLPQHKGGQSKEISLEKTEGWPVGHVVRTRRPYFCNDTARDPLMAGQAQAKKGISSELSAPIIHNEKVVATIHLQCKKGQYKFTREDAAKMGHILSQLEVPLANMKAHLYLKNLNHSLHQQIEESKKQNAIFHDVSTKSDENLAPAYTLQNKKIICRSESMKKILRTANKVAATDATCLLLGERGVGKEMFARHIHSVSTRCDKPFITVDCSALEENTLRAKIFGKQPGNKRGRAKKGLLELAQGGTLFFNHIEYLGRSLQSELNACIKDQQATRVGDKNPYTFNVRMMAASNVELRELADQEEFCEELHFALSTMILRIPCLRERPEDLAILATHFLNEGRPTEEQKSLSPGAINLLRKYHWPGNVRELQSVIKRAYILSDGIIVEKGHIEGIRLKKSAASGKQEFQEQTLEEVVRGHIQHTLDHLGGNKTKAAKILGITVKTLYNKIRVAQ